MHHDPAWLIPATIQENALFDASNCQEMSLPERQKDGNWRGRRTEIGAAGLPKQYAAIADKLAPTELAAIATRDIDKHHARH
jgi:hypothetical protein